MYIYVFKCAYIFVCTYIYLNMIEIDGNLDKSNS